MEDADKLQLVKVTSNICFVVIGLIIASLWFRIIVATFAVSPSLRKLCTKINFPNVPLS
jgi:hypothetical protein